jgi:hypothetical protein
MMGLSGEQTVSYWLVVKFDLALGSPATLTTVIAESEPPLSSVTVSLNTSTVS